MNLLFNNINVYEVCEKRKDEIANSAKNLSQKQLNNFTDEDLAAELTNQFKINVPKLVYDNVSVSQSRAEIDVSRNPGKVIFDRSQPSFMAGTKIIVHVPYDGDGGLFSVQPNRFTLNPPRADVFDNQLQLVFDVAGDSSWNIKASYEATLRKIEEYLTSLREAAAVLHRDLEQLAIVNVQGRRKQLQRNKDLVASLGLPMYIPNLIETRNTSKQEQSGRQVGRSSAAKVPAGRKNKLNTKWDLFISHASEDKEEIARPLALKLQEAGFKVWFDEMAILLGDSLRGKIDEELSRSRFGVIVLSKEFFSKRWTQAELDGLVSRETDGHKVILPVWHKVTRAQVADFSPMLAGRLAVLTSDGLEKVVEEITAVLNTQKS